MLASAPPVARRLRDARSLGEDNGGALQLPGAL